MRVPTRLWRSIGRYLLEGAAILGAAAGLIVAQHGHSDEQDEPEVEADGARLGEPPPAHPERLIPDVPPSPAELTVWRQLEGRVRLPGTASAPPRGLSRFRRHR
ncbi:DUF6059 family protein [Actinomadura sp. DC4]|uniref:DUF6059 family protein n=1 Tax=Actinomadura sp. DC4 TaxID=3055069 RepID=UPI00339D876A